MELKKWKKISILLKTDKAQKSWVLHKALKKRERKNMVIDTYVSQGFAVAKIQPWEKTPPGETDL